MMRIPPIGLPPVRYEPFSKENTDKATAKTNRVVTVIRRMLGIVIGPQFSIRIKHTHTL